MKNSQEVIREISELTTMIKKKYPELYRFIDESPITIPSSNNPQVDKAIMEDYLESIKKVLKNYIETNKGK
jgi:hypothetical protein